MTYKRSNGKVTPSEGLGILKPTKEEKVLWDEVLREQGLGMDRGLGGRVKDGRRRLVYGHDFLDGDGNNELLPEESE